MTSQSAARLALVTLALCFLCVIFPSAATVSAQACAPKFVTTIRVGAQPKAIAIDPATLALIANLPIGAQGNQGGDGIAVMDNQVYIANNAEGTVTVMSDNCNASPPMPTAMPSVTPTHMSTPTLTPSISDGVSVREETIIFDAYPYDSFWRDAYDATYNIAYKQFDQIAYRAAPRSTTSRNFKTVIIENDYLRLTFLPELGGRLWQVLYKPTQQNIFYNNRVLKPSPWGPAQQGGWLAVGGMEWALPVDEHGYVCCIPWS